MALNWREKQNRKEKRQVEKTQTKTYTNHMEIITTLQDKYGFMFGTITKSDINKMTDREKEKYVSAIKHTTTYDDSFLRKRGFKIPYTL